MSKPLDSSRTSQLTKFLEEASQIRGFPVTHSSLVRFLLAVRRKPAPDLWDVIASTREYIRVTMALLDKMDKEGLVVIDSQGRIQLTREGWNFARPLIGNGLPRQWRGFSQPRNRYGLRLPRPLANVLKEMEGLYQQIRPKNKYDQAPLIPQAAMAKAAYAIGRGDVTNKEVVCVGDDDLLSVILALTRLPKRVVALDIDRDLLKLIKATARHHDLPLETYRHDLREPIPKKLRHGFDLFITEPPDTVLGITSFVSRGVDLLKPLPGMAGYCGVSPTACPPKGLLALQENFYTMELTVSDWLPAFSDYPPVRTELKHVEVPDCYDPFYPPRKVWYISDLVRLTTTGQARGLFQKRVTKNISDYAQDARRYR